VPKLGAIEAGGTKFVCGVGTGPDDLVTVRIPTVDPAATAGAALDFFRARAPEGLSALGIGSFGPVDLRRDSPTYGFITSTPKTAWQNFDLAGAFHRELAIPIGFDTDVNAAAFGEARWGAAQGLANFIYLTVGTGIGGGAFTGGSILHGSNHPEMGHIQIPRDPHDSFAGGCPYHGDCLEGMASGPAMEKRWDTPAPDLPDNHPAWHLEAKYLALALASFSCTLSPQRIIMGGGVMERASIFPLINANLRTLLNEYIAAPEVVPPGLGNLSGVLGALALAEHAARL
jgi:fructokinase